MLTYLLILNYDMVIAIKIKHVLSIFIMHLNLETKAFFWYEVVLVVSSCKLFSFAIWFLINSERAVNPR